MSIKVILEFQSKPEMSEALKSAFENTLPDTRSFDGCISVQVIINQDNPLILILFETWQSRQHYEKYCGWRDESGGFKTLRGLLARRPDIRYFDHLDI
ncbi:MAG: antibiotic biosynthesis monooxygenase [Psychrosphaera sp.]|nr:antibiotic biosynthesis monooxygenase [Psychrosphaera sp.]